MKSCYQCQFGVFILNRWFMCSLDKNPVMQFPYYQKVDSVRFNPYIADSCNGYKEGFPVRLSDLGVPDPNYPDWWHRKSEKTFAFHEKNRF